METGLLESGQGIAFEPRHGQQHDMNFDAINDQLIVGSHPSNAPDIVKLYNENGVRAIVNLQRSEEQDSGDIDAITEQCALIGDRIWYQRVPIQDGSKESVRNKLPEAVGILNRAIQERAREHGETVYLHCCRGLYRAPSVAVAYLYWFTDMTLKKAVERVETARENSHPFVKVIQEVTSEILGANESGDLTAVQRDIIQGYVTDL
jgi:protein-tyrosine phosphatase